jgi:predicted acetyltransferase
VLELVRGIKEEELEEVSHLVELGYLRREHPYPNAGEELRQQTTEPGSQLENHRIVEREGQIVAHAITVFHEITYGSACVPAGSVGSVVSHPDYRGRHLGQKVMVGIVDYMKEKGCCMAFLGTGSPGFYRKLGWEFVGLEEIFTLKPASFDKLEVRNFEPGDLEKIKSLYAERIEGKFGYIIRDNERWQRLADVPQYTFLVTIPLL